VREALFSILASEGHPEPGARVLDLYAGSGALGIEAISRGAGEAVLVEQARDALAAIKENVRALGLDDRVRVVAQRVDRALGNPALLGGPFGVVFLDPPYADVKTSAFGGVLAAAAALVAPDGALVLEHASTDTPPEVASLSLDRSRRYGDTTVSLFRISEV
jgi:16S rRNA (guanine(966)-N(2))-methyltransferase RsmD